MLKRQLGPRLNRFVAVKVLPPDKLANEDRRRRFLQEAQSASALNRPNIVVLRNGIYAIDIGVAGSIAPSRQGEGFFYRFATKKLEKLGFMSPHIMNNNGMCLSPRLRWAYFAMVDSLGSDLMIVENFR